MKNCTIERRNVVKRIVKSLEKVYGQYGEPVALLVALELLNAQDSVTAKTQ